MNISFNTSGTEIDLPARWKCLLPNHKSNLSRERSELGEVRASLEKELLFEIRKFREHGLDNTLIPY
jgi:hypothetical protein